MPWKLPIGAAYYTRIHVYCLTSYIDTSYIGISLKMENARICFLLTRHLKMLFKTAYSKYKELLFIQLILCLMPKEKNFSVKFLNYTSLTCGIFYLFCPMNPVIFCPKFIIIWGPIILNRNNLICKDYNIPDMYKSIILMTSRA